MAEEDKLLGRRISNSQTTRIYAAYRIDYDSTDSVPNPDTALDPADLPGAAKNPPAGYPGHEPKDGYQRKVLVEDAATRDEITAYLDEQGIAYVVEDVAPTEDEKAALEEWGAENGLDGPKALEWKDAIESASTVEDLKTLQRNEHPGNGTKFAPPKARGKKPK